MLLPCSAHLRNSPRPNPMRRIPLAQHTVQTDPYFSSKQCSIALSIHKKYCCMPIAAQPAKRELWSQHVTMLWSSTCLRNFVLQ